MTVTETGLVVLEIPYVPPSVNAFGSGPNWRRGAAARKKLGNLLEQEMMIAAGRGQIPNRVDRIKARAIIIVHTDTAHRMDEDNFRPPLSKALGDVLDGGRHRTQVGKGKGSKWIKHYPEGRWLVDDTRAHFRFADVEFVYEPLPPPPEGMSKRDWRALHVRGRTQVRLRWWA